jgi:CRISPR/Cas system-associated exonuclease Cas4 (RecB family)
MEPTNKLSSSFTFSQSSLQDYIDCPRRFQLSYIEKLQWPAVEEEPVLETERRQKEGQLFHRLVQQHILGLPPESLSRLANTPDLSLWWKNYLHAGVNLPVGDCHTELVLTTPVGGHRLLAKYDLVSVQEDGKASIFDWKTSHKRPRDEWMAARMQTRVYRSLLVKAGSYLNGGKAFIPEDIDMVYWYAEYPSEPARFPYTTAQYERDWSALTGLINEIYNHQHFPLTDEEKKCAYCPYRSYCNRGVQAGVMDDAQEDEFSAAEINYEQIAEIEF